MVNFGQSASFVALNKLSIGSVRHLPGTLDNECLMFK